VKDILLALRKTSLVDYPGKISAVLFFPGCNLACPWCHNPELVRRRFDDGGRLENGITLNEALSFFDKRRNVLEAVVLSGGEATLYKDLPELITSIKKINLLVKLDTNGTRPDMLEHLFAHPLTRPDYIALDIKLSPSRYIELSNHQTQTDFGELCNSGELLKKSADLISRYNIEHEYRSLILPDQYLKEHDIDEMAELIDDAPWMFRPFIPGNCLDESWNAFSQTSADEQNLLIQRARSLGKNVVFFRPH
jgi:pyruvate formate lyase activating enzyme